MTGQSTLTLAEFLGRPPRRLDFRLWLADLTYTQQTVAADTIPFAIGGLATFLQRRLTFREPVRLFKYPEKLAEALDQEGPPEVLGFSNYVWNLNLAYGFARIIKERHPRTVVIFGGPNFPLDPGEQADFLRARPALDFYVAKEGELALANLVEALADHGLEAERVKPLGLPSVQTMDRNGAVHLNPPAERIADLVQIPSPYAAGLMDEFFDGKLLPVIQTNRGCPFSCTFCSEGVQYFSRVHRQPQPKLTAELDYVGRKMARLKAQGGRNDLFIADSNFGMYPEDLEVCRELARTKEVHGWPEYINVATGKEHKGRVLEAARLLKGALRLSGSVQSLDPQVLRHIKRHNIKTQGLMELALQAAETGANSYSEVILGLPGDSLAAHQTTVKTVMEAGFTNVVLFQLMLLKGSELDTPRTRREHGLVTRFRVLPRCFGRYEVLGQGMAAAEIEEICVASATLSFQEYLDCRRFHLLATIFYNDGVFSALLKLFRVLGLSVFDWLSHILQAPPPPGLARLMAAFEEATRQELWASAEELAEFIQRPGVVERYVAGELGNNLLFVHKTLALTGLVAELADLARRATRDLLARAGLASPEHLAFVEDALTFQSRRLSNIFTDREVVPQADLTYDVAAFEARPGPVAGFRLDRPRPCRFIQTEEQRDLVNRYLAIYGSTPVGLGRILSKVYVWRLLREQAWD